MTDEPLVCEMFDAAVERLGDRPLIYSWETPIAASECARLVDGLARALHGLGIGKGDRVGLFLQNDPQFYIASLSVWRLGAVTVPCNPMLRDELAHHLTDAGAVALIALDELYETVGRRAVPKTDVQHVITTGARDFVGGRGPDAGRADGVHDLLELADAGGPELPEVAIERGDTAVLTYTSGTTGPPKGAMNTHGNVAYASQIYRETLEVADGDVILGIAPLYHVTGLLAHLGLGLAAAVPTVLAHRFDPVEAARLTEHHSASVTVAAITAFMALANSEGARAHSVKSLTRTYSGGAPIPPAVVTDLRSRLGIEIRPVYGLTETTGPTHITPLAETAPTHPETGTIAVGKTTRDTTTRILDTETGDEVATGEPGEICIKGPQIVSGYWNKPEETAHAIPDGEMHTGDVGIVDADGWLYVVDRIKDMISASGFKVWPTEVEEVLYQHAAVREAAVIGVADEYRGETVWGYVSLNGSGDVEPDELVAHCKERLAAYKYPRVVRIVDELPKTPSGKIIRRELRELAQSE